MKLFDLFNTLSKEELRDLKRAVQSPLLTGNKRLLPLFEVLRKHHLKLEDNQTFREKIYQKVFTGKPFDDFSFRRLCTELTQVIEEFLLLQHFRKNDLERDEQLLKLFHNRDLHQLKAAKTKQIHKKLDQTVFPDATQLQTKYQLTTNLYRNPTMGHLDKQKHILTSIDYLNQYFILEKNLLLTELNIIERAIKDKQAPLMQEKIISFAKQYLDKGNINIQLSINLLQMMSSNDAEIYQTTKKQFFSAKEQFSPANQKANFFILINYAVYNLNIGTTGFDHELFELYKYGLVSEYLLNEEGYLSSGAFRNIVIIALKVDQLDWCRHFLFTYSSKLQNSEILPLCHAYIAMKEENFHKTIEILNAAQFSILGNTLTAKTTLLKAYFEIFQEDKSYFSILFSNIDSFRIYIKRKNLDANKTSRYLNLIKFLRRLSMLILEGNINKDTVSNIEKTILETSNVTSRKYLLEKIQQVKSENRLY